MLFISLFFSHLVSWFLFFLFLSLFFMACEWGIWALCATRLCHLFRLCLLLFGFGHSLNHSVCYSGIWSMLRYRISWFDALHRTKMSCFLCVFLSRSRLCLSTSRGGWVILYRPISDSLPHIFSFQDNRIQQVKKRLAFCITFWYCSHSLYLTRTHLTMFYKFLFVPFTSHTYMHTVAPAELHKMKMKISSGKTGKCKRTSTRARTYYVSTLM